MTETTLDTLTLDDLELYLDEGPVAKTDAPMIISRTKARKLGLKLFFTGEPCGNGHITERRVCNGQCVVCHNDKSSQYVRQRYAEDAEFREALLARGKNWRRENRERHNATSRALRAKASPEQKERRAAYNKEYNRQPDNRERHNAQEKERRANRSPEQKERDREWQREWSARNRERNREKLRVESGAYYEHLRDEVEAARELGIVPKSQNVWEAYYDLRALHLVPTPKGKY